MTVIFGGQVSGLTVQEGIIGNMKIENLEDCYNRTDEICTELKQAGFQELSVELRDAKLYGSTSGEILNRIGVCLRNALASKTKFPKPITEKMKAIKVWIDKAWKS